MPPTALRATRREATATGFDCGAGGARSRSSDCLLRWSGDRVQHIAFARERTAQHDETVSDERVHEPRVLVPAILIAQITRPVLRATALEPNREEHQREAYDPGSDGGLM